MRLRRPSLEAAALSPGYSSSRAGAPCAVARRAAARELASCTVRSACWYTSSGAGAEGVRASWWQVGQKATRRNQRTRQSAWTASERGRRQGVLE